MNDIADEFYEQADDDFRSNRNNALWIKCLTLARGDEVKARYEYIEMMARRLSSQTVSLTEQDLAMGEPQLQNLETIPIAKDAPITSKMPLKSIEKHSDEYRRLFRIFRNNEGNKYTYHQDDEYKYEFYWWLRRQNIFLVDEKSDNTETAESNGKKSSLIYMLFNGDIRLVYTFWFLLIGSRILFIIFQSSLRVWLPYMTSEQQSKIAEMTPMMLFTEASIYLFAVISTWRSANKYDGPSQWRVLSKIFIILFFLWVLTAAVSGYGNYLYYTGRV